MSKYWALCDLLYIPFFIRIYYENNKPSAIIRPDIFPVYENVEFEMIICLNKSLKKGDYIECQLANSFNADKTSNSFSKNWQFDD